MSGNSGGFLVYSAKVLQANDNVADSRGFKPSVSVVLCGLFPTDAADFEHLRESLGKLALNDASFKFEPESSAALGFGSTRSASSHIATPPKSAAASCARN